MNTRTAFLAAGPLIVLAMLGAWLLIEPAPTPGPEVDAGPSASPTSVPAKDIGPASSAGSLEHLQRGEEIRAIVNVDRSNGKILIDVEGVSRALVARSLAAATGTAIQGADLLEYLSAPITMKWTGDDAARAWDALLGKSVSMATSCEGGTCKLWLMSLRSTDQPKPGEAMAPSPATADGAALDTGSLARLPDYGLASTPRVPQAPPPLVAPVGRVQAPPVLLGDSQPAAGS